MLTGNNLMVKKDPQPSWVRKFGLLGVIVADLLGYTGAGLLIGYFLWAKLDLPWWVLLVTTTVGLVLAMYHLYFISQKEL